MFDSYVFMFDASISILDLYFVLASMSNVYFIYMSNASMLVLVSNAYSTYVPMSNIFSVYFWNVCVYCLLLLYLLRVFCLRLFFYV